MIFFSLARRLYCVDVKPNRQWLVSQRLTSPPPPPTPVINTSTQSIATATTDYLSLSSTSGHNRDCKSGSKAGFCVTCTILQAKPRPSLCVNLNVSACRH
jgi:hypothetical protein